MISGIVGAEPRRDFRVVYADGVVASSSAARRTQVFERRGGETLPGSDAALTRAPSVYVRKVFKYRPLPVDFLF